ncbi:MAG: stage V sporulation protein AD, partial [Traorella sp.]
LCLKQVNHPKIDLIYAGDLINQLCSNYLASEIKAPFIGLYGACSTSALALGQAAIAIEYLKMKNVLMFTSSHQQATERQFRYPNEYGIQKKECSTTTVTGSGSILLSNETNDLKITSFTIGEVIDWDFKDINDMGKSMVPAVYQTIMTHFKDLNRTFDDYDLILSGDLGKIGFAMLSEMLHQHRFSFDNKLNDCGILIYDNNEQEVYCGGSGCACSISVLISKVFDDLRSKKMKRVLLVASGSLHNVFLSQQKLSLPSIAHAICIERT